MSIIFGSYDASDIYWDMPSGAKFEFNTNRIDLIDDCWQKEWRFEFMDYRENQISTEYNGGASVAKPRTIRESVRDEIAMLKDRLDKKEQMLKLLDENPAIEKFMDLSR